MQSGGFRREGQALRMGEVALSIFLHNSQRPADNANPQPRSFTSPGPVRIRFMQTGSFPGEPCRESVNQMWLRRG